MSSSDLTDDVALSALSQPVAFPLPSSAKELRRLRKSPVHLIPAAISHDGPANVSAFFRPAPHVVRERSISTDAPEYVSTVTYADDKTIYKAALRGRGLTGLKLALPQDTIGVVLEQGAPAAAGLPGRGLAGASAGAEEGKESASVVNAHVDGVFTELYTWGKDKDPHDTAYVHKAMREFVPLAAAFHETD